MFLRLRPADIWAMTNAAQSIAFMAANPLPDIADGDDAPEWVHVLPRASGSLQTYDGRGPYFVRDEAAIIAASMAEGEIAIDQDHAIGKTGKTGQPALARGWITEMQSRDDGIWARVNWTKAGRELVASRAYRRLSPVIILDKVTREISKIREVSLVNRPNLRGLAVLNQEGSDMLHEKLIELLGLAEGATEDEVLAALAKAMAKPEGDDAPQVAEAQSALDQIAGIVGLQSGASSAAILAATRAVKATSATTSEQIAEMQTQLDELRGDGKRRKATEFVEDAKRRKAGISPEVSEHLVSLHMEGHEDACESIIGALPNLRETHTGGMPPSSSPAGKAGLTATEAQVAAMMGQDPAEYAKLRDALGQQEEAL